MLDNHKDQTNYAKSVGLTKKCDLIPFFNCCKIQACLLKINLVPTKNIVVNRGCKKINFTFYDWLVIRKTCFKKSFLCKYFEQ